MSHAFPNDQFVAHLVGGATFGLILFFLAIFVFFVAIAIFYCSLLHKTMNRVSEANRPVPGGLAWLAFIPLVGPVWILVFQILLSSAIKKDFISAGRPDHLDGALPMSIGMAVCAALTFFPVLGVIAALVHLVLFIVYWVRVSELKNKMPVATTVFITRR